MYRIIVARRAQNAIDALPDKAVAVLKLQSMRLLPTRVHPDTSSDMVKNVGVFVPGCTASFTPSKMTV